MARKPYSRRLDVDDILVIRRLLKRGSSPELIAACWGVSFYKIDKIDRQYREVRQEAQMLEGAQA